MRVDLIPVGGLAHNTMEGGADKGGYLEDAVVDVANCPFHFGHSYGLLKKAPIWLKSP